MTKALNINFSDEKLGLDYLVFNLPRFRTRIREVAEIFYKYGFNSRTYNVDTEKYSTILYDKPFPIRSLLYLKTSLGTKIIYPYTFKQATPVGFIFLSKGEFSLFLN